MSDDILKDINEYLKIDEDTAFEFKKIYGLTLVFKTTVTTVRDRLSSAEIKPVAIIYEENDQYYLAPLSELDNIEEIVKEYVKEEEYFHSQQ